MKESNLLLVKTEVLPEVFSKVVKAKYLLSCKRAKSASEAARMCGISRSAFYKYKDSVFVYNDWSLESVINISAVLEDKAGTLSNFIYTLREMGANILTINQGMPSGGVASVTVSYRSEEHGFEVDEILKRILEIDGVVSAYQVLGKI